MYLHRSLKYALVALLGLMLSACANTESRKTASSGGKTGVVIQVSDNDPAKWNLALANAKNVQQELGKDNVNIEIVAYGPGLEMLKFASPVGPKMDEAAQAGVKLLACGNTMKNQKVTKQDLHPTAQVVKAGVIEIMDRTREGYTYIRP